MYKGLNERTGELLAVKQLYLADGTTSEVETLCKEINVICDLNHENIVRCDSLSLSLSLSLPLSLLLLVSLKACMCRMHV